MNFPKEQGMTLLSLLAGVAVVALLVALGLGAMARASQRARAAECVSHLRQIGVALHLYMVENGGSYPPNRANPAYKDEKNPSGVHWQDSLKAYLMQSYPASDRNRTAKTVGVFWCPADTNRAYKLAHQSYGFNHKIGGSEPVAQQNIRVEAAPAQRLYLIDATTPTLSTCLISSNSWPFNNGAPNRPDTNTHVDFRHGHRANGLFLDGHVATFAVEDLRGRHPDKLN
ncbi:MAG TPA: hypothetical protein VNQ90_05020 [Chthoniobacteraceae bacterium]|nr:hypothetical protein [Chthoniobacteraceae bacterium]